MKIIIERRRVTDIYYDLNFYRGEHVCLGFPCNEHGKVSSWDILR